MDNDYTIAGPSLSLNDLCQEYQSLVVADRSPQIADFLDRVDAEQRGRLLHELVKLDIRLKEHGDSESEVDEWLHRYSGLLPEGEDRDALRSTIENAIASTEGDPDPEATVIGNFGGGRSQGALPEIDGFEIQSVLGRGGMGVVYKAVQTALNRTVALKMILDSTAPGEPIERFEKEAKAVAELNDPHFVQIYDFGRHKGRPYMTLEFVAGGSLEEFRQGEPQPERFTAEVLETLSRAMHTAHAAGLVHRDLKPQNVLMSGDGQPKISDFGLVKRQQEEETQLTQQGQVVGTASYMAPEQSRGEASVAAAADIHALGGILYCLLTARPPFLGANVYDTIRQVRNAAPVPPSRLRPGVSPDLETICLKCLHKEPEKRYASALDLAEDLRRFLDGRPIVARPVGVVEQSWRWAKRNPAAATAVGLAAAMMVILPVFSISLWVSNNRLETQTTRANTEATNANIARSKEQQERKKAEAAQATKSEQYNEVLTAYHDNLYYIDNLLRDNSDDVELRKLLINTSLVNLQKVLDPDESNAIFDRSEAVGHQRLGDIYAVSRELKQALEHYDKAYRVTKVAITKHPDEATLYRNLAIVCDKQGNVRKRLGDTLQARTKYQESLTASLQWEKKLASQQMVDHDPTRIVVAQSYVKLGAVNLSLGDAVTGLEHFTKAQEWYRKLPREVLLKKVYDELSALEHLLGQTHYQLGNADEAERYLTRAESKRAKRFAERKVTGRLSALSRSQLELGDLYLVSRQDLPKAWSQYKLALSGYQRLFKQDPESAIRRAGLANIEYRIGGLLLHAQKAGVELEDVPDGNAPNTHFEISCKLREELAAIDPDDMQARIEWAVALARCGRVQEAEELANELAEKGQGNPRLLFQAACTCALCSEADDKELADRCRERAFETLEQLIESGWKDRVILRDDPDLNPIKSDARYDELMKSLPRNVPSVDSLP